MGVPKFFRWLSERYPRINQRVGSLPKTETCERYFDKPPPPPPAGDFPDPLSTCGLPPPVDRLYVDMNGIIHGCSHNNDEDEDASRPKNSVTNENIFRNVCYYLDRLIGDLVEPTELVYLAIDGVAPRAKLNQQRSRRYRSGATEGEIETSIYEAHAKALEDEQRQRQLQAEAEEGGTTFFSSSSSKAEEANPFQMDDGFSFLDDSRESSSSSSNEFDGQSGASGGGESLKEIEPGRFKGKFQANAVGEGVDGADAGGSGDTDASGDIPFHSNVITPGTPFFQEFTRNLEHFIQYKISTDPKWQKLTIIMSGPNAPGEGEHKIMDFIRREKRRPDYNPNLRHCIMGQDGDLVMLGLATHEPNLVLLRERVVFNMMKQKQAVAHYSSHGEGSLDAYLHNPHFEFLHMGVLRDYIAFEFETQNVVHSSPFDLERTIDDFVFLTFFVGNDFLPHMPALDIADNAFDLLFHTYKQCRLRWERQAQTALENGEEPISPYLTDTGNLVSGKRLEEFLSGVGSHEDSYYDKKKQAASAEHKKMKKVYKRFGMDSNSLPDANLVASKEESDRMAYRKMLLESNDSATEEGQFNPVMSGEFQPTEDELEEGLISRMGNLLQNSLSGDDGNDDALKKWHAMGMSDQDLKGRYYHDKFGFTPFDEPKHLALRKAYIEGLVWNLKYYYEGCVSWEWYFPYHYGPMLSDLVNLDELLEDISFEGKLGAPLKPFEQLMGCMPPSHSRHLPKPYRWLMTDENSPIIDFYPRSFMVDMNGKRWPWEAVTLLPFIDSQRLLEASNQIQESDLTPEEQSRNAAGDAFIFRYNAAGTDRVPAVADTEGLRAIEENKAEKIDFTGSPMNFEPAESPVLEPVVSSNVTIPLPGFGSLREAPVQSLWRRKLGIDVFSTRSRYRTSCLEMKNVMPPLPPTETLGEQLVGTVVFLNYPYFLEGLVTAVSDEKVTMRGKGDPKLWSKREAQVWKAKRDGAIGQFVSGEGVTGTGGIIIRSEQPVTVSVRPFEKLVRSKAGDLVKSYAAFEVEVPLMSTFWNPSRLDDRLHLPSKIEKNFYTVAESKFDAKLLSKTSRKNHRGQGKKSLFPPRKLGSGQARKKKAMFSSKAHGDIHKRTFSCLSPNSTTARSNFASQSGSRIRAGGLGPRGRLALAGSLALGFFINGVAGSQFFGSRPSLHKPLIPEPKKGLDESQGVASWLEPPRGGDMHSPEGFMESAVPGLDFAHGTTTLSFVFQGGIVAAVDSRASLGSFVGSKTVEKVLPVNTHILGTMAGGAADCMYWIRNLKAKSGLYQLEEGTRISVARASRLLANTLFDERGSEKSVGTMIMGYDEETGPRIYYVDDTGKRIEGHLFSVGSGSTFALSILDLEYKHDLTEDEAVALGIKAIRHATFRDAFSGGYINVYVITEQGWRKVFTEDIAKIPKE